MKYETLVKILDQIRNEAPITRRTYYPDVSDLDKLNYARSRAYIHLFLKVSFGLLDFEEREHYITDKTYDGGIDGYYINQDNRTIYLIQSKFRTNEKNFEEKEICLEEILVMDINRILEGECKDENGNDYCGKIRQLQREISEIPDISRYSYKVILIANLNNVASSKLRTLTGGYSVELFNSEKCYNQLVFPVITGTYFNACDLNINIDLSNKNAGSKISYSVRTKISECEITVLFVPIIEIARIMEKYKNSILKYNPRSYLELDGKNVHKAIRDTVLTTNTNEFALFNNGITILSEETYINEKIGQKNKAQMTLKNPQILNGGQTSYTLSRIYKEENVNPEIVFEGKEVLVKVITLKNSDRLEDKLRLIDEISTATNKQTPVINADKFSNMEIHQNLQKLLFDRFGLLYERKRGEFADGLFNNYISKNQVIERNLFLRLYFTSNGQIIKGFQKKLFQNETIDQSILTNDDKLVRFYIGYNVFIRLAKSKHPNQKVDKKIYALVYIYIQKYYDDFVKYGPEDIDKNINRLDNDWKEFMQDMINSYPTRTIKKRNKYTGDLEDTIVKRNTYNYGNIEKDLVRYFSVNMK